MAANKKIYNIGYQGRSIESFCEALVHAKVRVLVDVRAAAWSHRPQYRKTALAGALRNHRIEYVHCKAAGNPFRPKLGIDQDWGTCERLYTKHVEAHPEVIGDLEEIILVQPAALFCYEAHRSECHRGVILSKLTERRPELVIVDL
ncbi:MULTISPECIES: DUF488 family protein [Sorangium]|uniref:DUF488 family protein n=1 Tax=Sorangium TaxID=39643 RepID=UPI003D9C2F1A